MTPPTTTPRRAKTTCRCCAAGCGLVVTIEGEGHVLRAEGDRTHPVTRGYSCAKGRAIPERHHAEDRLLWPFVDGRRVSWDECLSDLGDRLDRVRTRHGAESIGFFGGTGGAYDTLGWSAMRAVASALKTPQRYSVGTVDVAPLYRAAQMVTGFHLMLPHWVPELPGPSLAILLGIDLCVSHGYLGADGANPVQRLREYRAAGGEVWTIDPRTTRTARQSDRHLALRPGSDVYLLAWLVRELLEEGADEEELRASCAAADVVALRDAVRTFTLERACEQTSLDRRALLELLTSVREHARVAILSGTGAAFTPHALLVEWLRWVLLVVTGSLDRTDRSGMFFNPTSLAKLELASWSKPAPPEGRSDPAPSSRPDLPGFYGEHPCAALADEIEAGNLRALVVFGSNPLTALPEPDRVARALATLEALIVIDPFDNPLTQRATHALPASWQLERSDLRQRPASIQYAKALVEARGESRPGWWIFGAIADRLGLDPFGDGVSFEDRDEAACYRVLLADARVTLEDLEAAGVDGIETPRMDGWFRESVLRGRGWRIAPPVLLERLTALREDRGGEALLVAGRVAFATNSMLFPAALRREVVPPAVHVSPDVARAKGLADGDGVKVGTRVGELRGTVTVDADLGEGMVWMNHGWSDRNVNELIDTGDIDPLTVQPAFSAIPVLIEKVSAASGSA